MSRRRRRGRGKPGNRSGSGLLLVVLLALTIVSWPVSLRPLLQLASTMSWSASQCTITAQQWQEKSRGVRLRDRRRTLQLHYSYVVEGRTLEGSAVNVTDLVKRIRERKDDREHADRYAVGSFHRCWVDPQPPHAAVLERSATGLPWLLSGLLALLTLLTVFSLAGRRN